MAKCGVIVCGSAWGLGVTTDDSGEAISYGFPCTDNPHNFHPDYEMSTEKEIATWEKAKEIYEATK